MRRACATFAAYVGGSSDLGAPPLRVLLRIVRPLLGPVIAAGLLVGLEAAVSLATPRLAGVGFDAAIGERGRGAGGPPFSLIIVGLIGLFAARALLSYVQTRLVGGAGTRILRELRERLHAHLLAQPPDFFETRRLGELLSRLSADVQNIQSTVTRRIPEGIQAVLSFVGTIVILLTMHVRLTLTIALIVPAIVGFSIFYGRRLQRLSRQVQDSLAESSATAEESLAGVRTVQAYGAEPAERARYRGRLGELLELGLRYVRLSAAFYALLQFVGFGAFGLVLWYGGTLITRGEITPGELIAFMLYAINVASSMGALGMLYGGLRELRGASQRVLEILETVPAVRNAPGATALADPRGALSLREVSYHYQGSALPALDGVSLDIAAGETVALVGPSGAGKSTLFSLLLRFRDPSAGRVCFDGRDLRDIDLASLRAAMALVPQEIFLFHGTVADNIRYGAESADDQAVRDAAAAAGADGFIAALSEQYQTMVGERGVKLSAGQRQRIAIARAFLRQPRVLLLDEATSSLDPDSEATIQRSLAELMRGRTTLVIAHRLTTAKVASRIAVMERGQVIAVGSHQELHETMELYRRYWSLQSLKTG